MTKKQTKELIERRVATCLFLDIKKLFSVLLFRFFGILINFRISPHFYVLYKFDQFEHKNEYFSPNSLLIQNDDFEYAFIAFFFVNYVICY